MNSGITARAKPRVLRAAAGAALLAGAALPAFAAESTVTDMPTEVAGVNVDASTPPLQADTEIAVLPTSVQDTPQSITVITNAQLRTQGVNTLEQALRQVPGITVSIGEGGALNGDQFKIRGFAGQDDLYIDGLRDFGLYTRDSFAFESVQVLKGPSGALFGRGSIGGAVNILSKRPRLTDAMTFDLYGGNGGYFRALADINHQINDTTAFRLNLMFQDSGVVGRDFVTTNRWGGAATIGFGLGTPTNFILNYVHQTDHRRPDYGVIIVQRPGELIALPAPSYDEIGVERSSFMGMLDDADNTQADVLTARFAHRFSDQFSLTSDARYGNYSRYFQYSNTDNCSAACNAALFDGDPATLALAAMGGGGPYDNDAQGFESLTTVRFDSPSGWGLRTQLIAGFDISWQENDKLFYAYTLPAGLTARNQIPRNLVDPNPALPTGYAVYLPTPQIQCPVAACSTTPTTIQLSHGRAIDYAAFLSGRVWFTDTISLLGSVRYDRYEATLDTTLVNGQVSRIFANSDLINPRVSLVWEPNDLTTVYATWGRSSVPPGTSIINTGTAFTSLTGQLEPETTDSYEVGAKLSFYDGRFAVTGALFQVTKDNATVPDPNGGPFVVAQSGERDRLRGVELSAIGQLPGGVTLSANYTYLDSEILEVYTNCSATTLPCAPGAPAATPTLNTLIVGRDVFFTPAHSASLWVTWTVPDTGWELGGGAAYQAEYFTTYTTATVGNVTSISRIAMIPENLNFDAYVAYRWDRYRVGLNVNNIADRLNYSQGQNNRGGPAPGRSFIVSLSATY